MDIKLVCCVMIVKLMEYQTACMRRAVGILQTVPTKWWANIMVQLLIELILLNPKISPN
jgi:hypothetical protein